MTNILMIVIIIVLFVVTASYIEFKSEKDKQLYDCYTKMTFKGYASASGCVGNNTPQCEHCYYHKIYKKRGML